MNLHDWIDEVCDLLDIETEADEGLLTDLSELAGENVHHAAGPVTAYLLGVAASAHGADPDRVERMAAEVQGLAEGWDRPAGGPGNDEVPDAEELTDLAAADAVDEEYDSDDDQDHDQEYDEEESLV